MLWVFSSILEIRLLCEHWTVHNLECVRTHNICVPVDESISFTYSVLDTYHETVPKESARMTEESSLDLCYEMINHKSSAVISECSPHLPVSAYKSISSPA